MEWGKPEILWWLLALIIPILVHLLHFRRYKTVEFSNVSFLADVEKETRSQQRLKNLLILLLRLIAVAAVVLAFADPIIPFDTEASSTAKSNIVNLYVDNSYSMQAEGELGSLLDEAKQNATTIAEGHSETNRFRIITNEFNGRDSRFLTQEECLERIASISPTAITRDLSSVVRRASLDEASGNTSSLYLFSDLQKSSHSLNADFTPDSLLSLLFVPGLANDRPNIWVDSAWFSSPIATSGKQADLNLRIKHNSLREIEGLPMMLEVSGERKAVGTYNISPGLYTDTVLKFSFPAPGFYHASISIDDSPIEFDNQYNLGFEVVDEIRVLQISEGADGYDSKSVENVCNSSYPSVSITTLSNLPSEIELSGYDLVISNGVKNPSSGYTESISSFVENGGTALILPDSSEISSRVNGLLRELNLGDGFVWSKERELVSIKSINTEHPFFTGVFSSKVSGRLDLPKTRFSLEGQLSSDVESLGLNWDGGNAFSKSSLGEGSSYLFHIPLSRESGNITTHALFVPIILRVAENARAAKLSAVTIGEQEAIEFRRSTEEGAAFRITESTGASSIIPEVRTKGGLLRLSFNGDLVKEGNYHVVENSDTVAVFSANVSRKESDCSTYDIPEFEKALENSSWGSVSKVVDARGGSLGELVEKIKSGNHLWWYLVLIVIAALAGETLLQKRWKTTS